MSADAHHSGCFQASLVLQVFSPFHIELTDIYYFSVASNFYLFFCFVPSGVDYHVFAHLFKILVSCGGLLPMFLGAFLPPFSVASIVIFINLPVASSVSPLTSSFEL